jgi:uncharacterized glyoxalase superfamily protein PhnB
MAFLSVMPNLYVSEGERSAAFYRDLLGGIETFRLPDEGPAVHVELRVGSVMVALSAATEVAKQGLPAPTPGRPLELVVWCDSADEAIEGLRAAGVPVLVEPYSHVSGTSRGYVTDPDGNWDSDGQQDHCLAEPSSIRHSPFRAGSEFRVLLVDGDLAGGVGGERGAVPVGPAMLEAEARQAGHQVELGWPDVAELPGALDPAAVEQRPVVGGEQLARGVVERVDADVGR